MIGPPRILIIAGSDSGGGAGIQADVKTVTMLGGHAMTAITAITAQNTLGVQAVMPVPADLVVAQMNSVIGDLGVDAVKIGMIGSPETVHAIADQLEFLRGGDAEKGGLPIVFDPVMVATSGSVLADEATIAAFDRLLRMATLATPNIPELATLAGMDVRSEPDRDRAVEEVMDRTGCKALLAKGGHELRTQAPDQVVDWLFEDCNEHRWINPRIDTPHTHGTGCTLASAIAVGLGRGLALVDAVDLGIAYTRAALAAAPGFGAGHGPMGHALGQVPFELIHRKD